MSCLTKETYIAKVQKKKEYALWPIIIGNICQKKNKNKPRSAKIMEITEKEFKTAITIILSMLKDLKKY